MSLTINTNVYEFDTSRTPDSARYHGPNHTISSNDYLELKRSKTAATTDFAGMARGYTKFSRAITDGTDPLGDAIVNITFAIPVGSAEAEIDDLVADSAAAVAHAFQLTLVKNHDIKY